MFRLMYFRMGERGPAPNVEHIRSGAGFVETRSGVGRRDSHDFRSQQRLREDIGRIAQGNNHMPILKSFYTSFNQVSAEKHSGLGFICT